MRSCTFLPPIMEAVVVSGDEAVEIIEDMVERGDLGVCANAGHVERRGMMLAVLALRLIAALEQAGVELADGADLHRRAGCPVASRG